VIAEMRGVSDEEGNSPFWDGLGSHFFAMPFAKADYLSGLGNKAFIAELMPKLPIYLNLLNDGAKAVIGKVHDNTLPALRMLEGEGFDNLGYVDIFDGGPTIEANIRHIRAISNSVVLPVEIATTDPDETAYPCLVSNLSVDNYRCTLLTLSLPRAHQDGIIKLDQATADALALMPNDKVRVVALSARQGL
jgi:arginine N-succinyltransferase